MRLFSPSLPLTRGGGNRLPNDLSAGHSFTYGEQEGALRARSVGAVDARHFVYVVGEDEGKNERANKIQELAETKGL